VSAVDLVPNSAAGRGPARCLRRSRRPSTVPQPGQGW